MTKTKVLLRGNVTPLVMRVLTEKVESGEFEVVVENMEVGISDYDMVAEEGNLLPVLKEGQEVVFSDNFDELCESIKLIEDKPQWTAAKTKTIAKHDYPWYHKPRF